MGDVEFVRSYVIHRRRHPKYVKRCDVCRRAIAFLQSATAAANIDIELPFVVEPNNFGRGASDKPWKQKMRRQRCHYCKGPGGTIDHIVPRSKGGKDIFRNCVPACHPCNELKANMGYGEFVILKKLGILHA